MYVERLPVEIVGRGGEKYFLRIKARTHKKKWCVRYIRKVHKEDSQVEGWRYRTELQAWGRTLENASKLMISRLEAHYPRNLANVRHG